MRVSQILRSSTTAAILGIGGVLSIGIHTFIREQLDADLPIDGTVATGLTGAGKELAFEPIGLFAVTSDRIQLWLIVIGVVFATTAVAIGYCNARSGHTDHKNATGLAFGAFAVIWGAMIASGQL